MDTSGKDEFVALMLLVKKAIVDSTTVVDLNILIPALENHIAQSNQQAVQKALIEKLEEMRDQWAVWLTEPDDKDECKISDVVADFNNHIAELAAAQPRKDGDE